MVDWLKDVREEGRQLQNIQAQSEQVTRRFIDDYSKDIMRILQETCDLLNGQNRAALHRFSVQQFNRGPLAGYTWTIGSVINLSVTPFPGKSSGFARVNYSVDNLFLDGSRLQFSFIDDWLKPKILETLRARTY